MSQLPTLESEFIEPKAYTMSRIQVSDLRSVRDLSRDAMASIAGGLTIGTKGGIRLKLRCVRTIFGFKVCAWVLAGQ